MQTTTIRLGSGVKRTWKLTWEHANSAKVMTQAIRAVKDVVLKNITPQGLTTAEIFKLTQTMQNPPQFRPALLPKNAAPPPFPRKLIRSQA